MPLEPVVGSALSVLVENPRLANRLSIVEGSLQNDVAQALEQRTVGISLAISERVVFPMAGDPFLGNDCRRQPQPETHGERGQVVQLHAAVGLGAVEEQGY